MNEAEVRFAKLKPSIVHMSYEDSLKIILEVRESRRITKAFKKRKTKSKASAKAPVETIKQKLAKLSPEDQIKFLQKLKSMRG